MLVRVLEKSKFSLSHLLAAVSTTTIRKRLGPASLAEPLVQGPIHGIAAKVCVASLDVENDALEHGPELALGGEQAAGDGKAVGSFWPCGDRDGAADVAAVVDI
jgi:hypothetical protein